MKRTTQATLIDDVVRALRQLGGRAPKSQVLLLIYYWHEDEFAQPYFQDVVNVTVPRWRKNVEWAKQKAVIEGHVMRPHKSGRGTWELTVK